MLVRDGVRFWLAVLIAMMWGLSSAEGAPALKNGSFEESGLDGEAGPPKDWEVPVLGAAPTVGQDSRTVKVGKYSARMSARQPTMAGLQQVADVEAGKAYVLRGWVKTDQLEPREGAGMLATLLVGPLQEPDASKTVVGPSLRGSTDWTRVRVEFKGPLQGKVFIFCTLCGEGNATGTVWFDGLELLPAEEAPPEPATSQPATATAPATAPGPTTAPASQPVASAPSTQPTTQASGTQPAGSQPAVPQIAGTLPATSQPQRPSDAQILPPITVTTEALCAKPVSPILYGNFIESGFGRQVDGMWSEMLYNRSFEAVTPLKSSVWGWLQRKPGDVLANEVWHHSGYEESPWYLAESNPAASLGYPRYGRFHHGLQAAQVTNKATDKPAYIVQDGLVLRPGMTYTLRGALRSADNSEFAITIGIHPEKSLDKPIAQKTIGDIDPEWKAVEAPLANAEFAGRGSLAISVPPGKALRLDGLSLMPSDHVKGWRKDVVEIVKRTRPRIIRFPGGCYASFYNWRDGVGPRTDRRPRESEYWGGLEYNDVGTVEFVDLCREVGAEPLLCVNMMTGSAAEAAEWVAYCNVAESHPMGALRRAHGHETMGVRFWELDNEPYRRFGPIEYAKRCVEFAREMKKVDPSIKVIMAGYESYRPTLPQMLAEAGDAIDLASDRGTGEAYLREVLKVIAEYNAAKQQDVQLCNTEWLAPLDNVPFISDKGREPQPAEKTIQNRQIRWAYAMNLVRQFLVFQRLGGDFVFANFNNMANTWGQNVIECPKERAFLSAAGRAFELVSQSPAAWPLKLQGYEETPNLVAQVAWDVRRQALVFNVVNSGATYLVVPFNLAALKPVVTKVDISTLHAASPATFNSVSDPEAVDREDTRKPVVNLENFVLEVPPFSVVQAVLH
ncbi:MAG TPA: hypothetical protein PKY77_15735 [Phycisphaerae bacterium]|nr:hypothetical protein [Phycisphaerae bacterium]HRY66855.1 hypothetical protein [Phycisphaerae bacterium]HSA26913.1 hypothetical protein [Phycisphaerae bacterium]